MPDTTPPPAEATIGHNQPPPDALTLVERLTAEHSDLVKRAEDLTEAIGRFNDAVTVDDNGRKVMRISDDETEKRATDFAGQLAKAVKSLEGARETAKAPFWSACLTVDGFFKNLSRPLDDAKKRIADLLTRYKVAKQEAERRRVEEEQRCLREEAERKAREAAEAERAAEAARKQAEAAQPALQPVVQQVAEAHQERAAEAETQAVAAVVAADAIADSAEARVAEAGRTRGDYGGFSGLRRPWDFEITDPKAVPREYMMIDEKAIRAAMQAAVRNKNIETFSIPGVRFFQKHSTQIRA